MAYLFVMESVANEQSVSSGVAGRYARALFELSEAGGESDTTLGHLETFARALDESADLDRLVRSPLFSSDEQIAALNALVPKLGIGQVAGHFLKLLAKNRRLFVVRDTIVAFKALLAEKRGTTIAEVVAAEPLSEAKTEALKSAIKAALGKDVTLLSKVDPSLIGGLTVKVGSRMIDTSLKTKLSQLKIALKEVR